MKRILLLEESINTLVLLSRTLHEEYPDIHFFHTRTVHEAQLMSAEFPMDLFIIDASFDGGIGFSGIDFFYDIKTANSQSQVILLTSSELEEHKSQAEAFGVLLFMQKPVDVAYLKHKILSVINAQKLHDDSQFQAKLTNLAPVDIIQLKSLTQATEALEFRNREGLTGQIFIIDGQIVHAVMGDMVGVEAFNHIVAMKGGSVHQLTQSQLPPRTIHDSLQKLLLGAAQTIDEANPDHHQAA